MGVDVYLFRYLNKTETTKKEERFTEVVQKMWRDMRPFSSSTISEDIMGKCREVALEMGLDEHGEDINNKYRIYLDSKKYPNHQFKIGYFRGIFSDLTFNSILDEMDVPDLYDIFDKREDDLYLPDWNKCLERIQKSLDEFNSCIDEDWKLIEDLTGRGFEWHRQALEIVKETIEYVLSTSEINEYYLSWVN